MENNALPGEERKGYWGDVLKKAVMYTLAVIGLLAVWLGWLIYSYFSSERDYFVEVPDKILLTINFDAPINEIRSEDLFGEFSGWPQLSFYDLISLIRQAKLDPKVKAIAANVSVSGLGMAQIQELKDEIHSFKLSGKRAYIYSDGFGAMGGGTNEYYLATGFNEISLMPNSEVGITGVAMEVPFFRDVLDKVGIEPEFYARYEYKSGAAPLTDSKMSKEFRSEMTKLAEVMHMVFTMDASDMRHIPEEKLIEMVNRAPIFSEEAFKQRLVDHLEFKTDYIRRLERDVDAKVLSASDYYRVMSDKKKTSSQPGKIAYMVIEGTITGGESNLDPWSGELTTGSDTFLRDLYEVEKEPLLKGLILRINSPGGSYTASNEIRNAIVKFKEKHNIPVVVTMGNYAASGGYFVALAGDKSFAGMTTITGSIGVFGGKMVLAGLWEKLGVNWGNIYIGDNAGIMSANHKFTPREAEIFNASLDNVYKDFTAKAAQARNMSLEEMDKLARGRVFSGADAVRLGLVDEIGGIDAAADWLYKELKDEKRYANVIVYYPGEKNFQQKLSELIGGSQKISVNKAVKEMGFDVNDIRMLNRLQYETVLPPFKINY